MRNQNPHPKGILIRKLHIYRFHKNKNVLLENSIIQWQRSILVVSDINCMQESLLKHHIDFMVTPDTWDHLKLIFHFDVAALWCTAQYILLIFPYLVQQTDRQVLNNILTSPSTSPLCTSETFSANCHYKKYFLIKEYRALYPTSVISLCKKSSHFDS